MNTSNNGWAWAHRELPLPSIREFYDSRLRSRIDNGTPELRGFTLFEQWTVSFEFCPRGKDENDRPHWVLLTAWVPFDAESPTGTEILDNPVFNHVKNGQQRLPAGLSPLDYNMDFAKLAYEGGKLELEIPSEQALKLIQGIRKRRAVDITFYCEKPDGKVTIETAKKP